MYIGPTYIHSLAHELGPHTNIMSNVLIGIHVLAGCDSNSALAGLGKKTVSKCYMRGNSIKVALDSLEKKLSSVTTLREHVRLSYAQYTQQ